MSGKIPDSAIEHLLDNLSDTAEETGYHLNRDKDFVKDLVRGLIENENRYGYRSCPCRLSSLSKDVDMDIICPCDYRDDDLNDYGACYCALYVSDEVLSGKKELQQIPERRPPYHERKALKTTGQNAPKGKLTHPVWRCPVCGYLCAKEEPPEKCPICKAEKERFERFM